MDGRHLISSSELFSEAEPLGFVASCVMFLFPEYICTEYRLFLCSFRVSLAVFRYNYYFSCNVNSHFYIKNKKNKQMYRSKVWGHLKIFQ